MFFPANEVEEEGVNIVHEVVYDDSAPLAYAEANPNKQLKAATISIPQGRRREEKEGGCERRGETGERQKKEG